MSHRTDFVGHKIFDLRDSEPIDPTAVSNIIVEPTDPDLQWINESTRKFGDWRATFRSAYISWALTINGLHKANEKYAAESWKKGHQFKIDSVRATPSGLSKQPIAIWEGGQVAEAHLKPLNMLNAYGLIDLYSCLEEFVFGLYRIFWWSNPRQIMQGREFADLRRIHSRKDDGETEESEWKAAFEERLDSWQRKKLYEGLDKVLLAYCEHAGIQAPSAYRHTTVETWAETIKGVALARNCLAHGEIIVPEELGEFCKTPYSMTFDFVEGRELQIELYHLMGLECFLDQLLDALNVAFVERVHGTIPSA